MAFFVLFLLAFAFWKICKSAAKAEHRQQQQHYRQQLEAHRRQREPQLVPLQNYLLGSSYLKLVVTEDQLERILQQRLQRQKRSIMVCNAALNTTDSPKVFFENLNTLLFIKHDLQELEKLSKRQFIARFATDEELSCLTNMMIDRFWKSCLLKSINARSSKDKMNRIHAFFNTLALFNNQMTDENRSHIDTYRKPAMDLFIKYI